MCDAIVGTIDFLPTFVKLAGGTVPTDNKIDGKDIAPLLLGQTKESPHEARYYYSGYKLQAVRVGPWKLAVAPQTDGMGKGGSNVPASLDKPRLYNLDKEIGEQTDVAAANPEVVARLKALVLKMETDLGTSKPGPGVREAGRVENPVTLYPIEDGGRKAAPKKNTKAAAAAATNATKTSMEDLKIGDTVGGTDAPQVAGRPITITCEVETKARDGVIVAHGGIGVGYTLYVKDARLVFALRRSADEITRITSAAALGEHAKIEARLAADGAMTLAIDDKQAATSKAGGVLGKQPVENFCVGHDDKKTVDDYDGAKPFQGAIRNLKVSTETQRLPR